MIRKIALRPGYCLLIFLAVLALSCNRRRFGEIIPPRKIINVLVDIHLADGIAMENMSYTSKEVRLDSASLYQSVFDKYGVTAAMFDSTMSFYTEHPNEFQDVYNKVTAKLKRKEDELNAQLNKEQKRKTEVVDTILKK